MIWWFPIAAAAPAFLLWDVVHEGAHALSALMCGRKIQSFEPWPHKTKSGNFVFGQVTYDREGNTFTSLAPYIVDVLAFTAFILGFIFVPNEWSRNAMVVLLACPTVNSVVAVQARFRGNSGSDLGKVHWGWAVPFYYVVLAYLLLWGWQVLPWVIGG